jgi:NAD(P)-dependent dehydrogenase (short-subunit alcohol dehydrogenase family)
MHNNVTKLLPFGQVSSYGLRLRPCRKRQHDGEYQGAFHQTGKLNHIVFTASNALPIVPLHDITLEKIQQAGLMRFYPPLLMAKHASEGLTGGPNSSITFTGGVIAERPTPNWLLVTAFTRGLQGIARAPAIELKPVRVNVVQPGMVSNTNLWATNGIPDEAKQSLFAETKQRMPVQKVGTVEDLVEAYIYLMKGENITGEIIKSSGGQVIIREFVLQQMST